MPDGSLSSNRERSGRVNGAMAMIGWGGTGGLVMVLELVVVVVVVVVVY